jgi:hypothetical protein
VRQQQHKQLHWIMTCHYRSLWWRMVWQLQFAWHGRYRHLYTATSMSNLSDERFHISMYTAATLGVLHLKLLLIFCYSYPLFSWRHRETHTSPWFLNNATSSVTGCRHLECCRAHTLSNSATSGSNGSPVNKRPITFISMSGNIF